MTKSNTSNFFIVVAWGVVLGLVLTILALPGVIGYNVAGGWLKLRKPTAV